MKLSAKFENHKCELSMIPETEWEKSLLGVLAGGGSILDAAVEYKSDGHFSYGKASVVKIVLTKPEDLALSGEEQT